MTQAKTSPDPAELHAAVRSQHERLQLLLRATREVLAARSGQRDGDELSSTMLVLLTYLSEELVAHFEYEEHGGYFSDVLRVAPQLSRALDRFQEEHIELARSSRAVLDLSHNAVKDPRRWQEVESEFGRLFERLRNHEREENTMVQRAFSDDVGQSG